MTHRLVCMAKDTWHASGFREGHWRVDSEVLEGNWDQGKGCWGLEGIIITGWLLEGFLMFELLKGYCKVDEGLSGG